MDTKTQVETQVETWMRGPLAGVNPLIAPVLFTFQQVIEDLNRHTEGLTTEQVWARPHGLTSLGFHIRHLGGAVERLPVYLAGGDLQERQLADLAMEAEPGESIDELLSELQRRLHEAEEVIRLIEPEMLAEPRTVGRMRLPTTVIGLLVHMAEHSQRHLGQAISAGKLSAVY